MSLASTAGWLGCAGTPLSITWITLLSKVVTCEMIWPATNAACAGGGNVMLAGGCAGAGVGVALGCCAVMVPVMRQTMAISIVFMIDFDFAHPSGA